MSNTEETMFKRIFWGVALALGLVLAGAQDGQAKYPERTITLVVPFAAGGNSDIIARLVGDHLSKTLGQTVVIENRGGSGGTIGSDIVARAKPDGYTLLFATAGTHSVNPALRKTPYDPIGDFTPVSVAVISQALVVINPSVKAKDLKELMALTKKGEKLNFASGGMGTLAHVAGEIYNEQTGSSMVHVPYKGAGQALSDLLANRVQVFINNIPGFMSYFGTDKIRILAIASDKRSELLPDVPTTVEAGLPALQMGSWFGVIAPKGTSKEAIDVLHKAMVSMKGSPELKKRMAEIGCEITVSQSPEAFGSYMKDQLTWWTKTLDKPVFKTK
jgi:tripartite-type tricarboxylate transporter receptor subunit TctC